MDGGAWWAIVHGVTQSGTRLSDLTLGLGTHADLQFGKITLARRMGFKRARGHYVLERNHDGLSKA